MYDASAIEVILRVLREGLMLSLLVSAPVLLAALLTGLLSGAVQAVTQIHDHAVGFVPRLLVMLLVLVILGPYLGAQVVRFTQAVFAGVGALP